MWDKFLNESDVLVSLDRKFTLLDEAAQEVNSDDDNIPDNPNTAKDENKIAQMAKSFSRGDLTQEELIKMYQTGAISREEIDDILVGPEQTPEPTEEDILGQEISQVNDTFIRFTVYDKINDLEAKLAQFITNFNDISSNMHTEITQVQEFLKIMSSLVFTLDINTLYHMYGGIELKLIKIFNDYLTHSEANKKMDDIDNMEDNNGTD